jgi:molybdate transport system substrate-binding protein
MNRLQTVLLWCLLAPSLPQAAAEVRVAVASNFLGPLRQIASTFEQDSGQRVIVSSGSTGKLYAQIVNGAPYDLFLAANAREPQRLEAQSLIEPGTRKTYARGVLALWAPAAAATVADDPRELLAADRSARVALANPDTAPYGAAAQAVLLAWGLQDSYRGRIIQGENVAQAYQYVASGNATFGFVALAQLQNPVQPATGRYWRIDAQLYPPIRQQMVLLKRAADNPAAQALWRYLGAAAVRARITALGYDPE